MEIEPCPYCGQTSVLEKNEIKASRGIKIVKAESLIYRCLNCKRTHEKKDDKLTTLNTLHKGEQRINTEQRIHRTKNKNREKIPPDTTGERVFQR